MYASVAIQVLPKVDTEEEVVRIFVLYTVVLNC